MNKTQYNAIAEPFAHKVKWTQYLYAKQGFKKGVHSERGRTLYAHFTDLDSIVYRIANNLAEVNQDFNRDKFLEACGMQRDNRYDWSFVPSREYIEEVNSR